MEAKLKGKSTKIWTHLTSSPDFSGKIKNFKVLHKQVTSHRKRPLVFVGQRDTYILRDTNKEGAGVAYDRWGDVGTDKEQEPLIMR